MADQINDPIRESYNVFVKNGYSGTIEEFKELIKSTPEALKDSFDMYSKSVGYKGTIDDYKSIIGISKKKEGTASLPGIGLSAPAAAAPADVKSFKPIMPVEKGSPLAKSNVPQFIEEQLSTITPEFISKSDAYAVPQLQNKFGPLGFKFNAGYDGSVRATSPDGKEEIEVSFDPFFGLGEKEEAAKLDDFIRRNSAKIPNVESLEREYVGEKKKYTTQKDVDETIARANKKAKEFNSRITSLYKERDLIEDEIDETITSPLDYALDAISGKPVAPLSKDEIEAQRKARQIKIAELKKKKEEIEKRISGVASSTEFIEGYKELEAEREAIKKSVGEWAIMKSKQGTKLGLLKNSFLTGAGRISAEFAGSAISNFITPLSFALSSESAVLDVYKDAAIRLNLQPPSDAAKFKSWFESLSEDDKRMIKDEAFEEEKKRLKYGDTGEGGIRKGGITDDVRKGLRVLFGSEDVTAEYEDLTKQGFWMGSLAGLAESLPAMIGGGGTIGWAQRTAQMFLQTSDYIREEMSKDPDFANISESEKSKVILPYAIGSAVLEARGLRNVIASKGVLNNLIFRALSKTGSNVSAKSFAEFIKNDVKNGLARGTLVVAGGALAEAETGASQRLLEIGIKEIYNESKDKEMFKDLPKTFTEIVGDVAYSGAQEAVGGGIIGMIPGVAAAYRKRGFEGMSDEDFIFLESAANDVNIEKAFIASLRSRAASGEVSMEDARQTLNDYRNAVGLFNSLPENLSTKGKKEAMNLLREKRDLENQIAGKDEAVTSVQRNRIKEINDQLTKISENAVQEQSTDAGVLRSEGPEMGLQQVGEGDQGAQVAATGTQEGVAPEVTPQVTPEVAPEVAPGVTEGAKDLGISIDDESIDARITDEKQKGIVSLARTAVNSIKSIMPNIEFIVHDSQDSYTAAVAPRKGMASSGGNFSIETMEDGTKKYRIDINLTKANKRVIAHEITHAVLHDKFNNSVEAFTDFNNRLSKVVSSMTPQMFIDDKGNATTVKQALDRFVKRYTDKSVRPEEYLAELSAMLANNEAKISLTGWQKIAAMINEFVSDITGGKLKVFEDIKNTKDVVDFFKSVSSAIAKGEDVAGFDIASARNTSAIEQGLSAPIGGPTTIISRASRSSDVKFPKTPLPLSFVTEADKINISELIDYIIKNNLKVWFWTADQLGRGNYYDEVIDGEHYLDAGPSFALDPENREKGILWASGVTESVLAKNVKDADYIFFISGSHEASKLFNKRVLELFAERVKKKSSFDKFKKAINRFKSKKETKELATIREILNSVGSFEDLAEKSSRKPFLLAIKKVGELKTTPSGSLKQLLGSFNAFIDYNNLRDGFYRENGFTQNDIMLVGKPTKLGGKAPHSTYSTAIMGEVVGVPDKRINAWDIMPSSVKEKYPSSTIPVQSKVIAAESGVVRELGPAVVSKASMLGDLKDVKSTAKALENVFNIDYKNTISDKLSNFDKQISDKKFPSVLEVAEYVLPRKIFAKYKSLYELAARNNINVSNEKIPPGMVASWAYGNIQLNKQVVKLYLDNYEEFAETLNHEIIHALISRGVRNNYALYNDLKYVMQNVLDKFDSASDEVKSIISYIQDTRNEFIEKDIFGATSEELESDKLKEVGNLEELITYAFTNKEFANFLDSIPASKNINVKGNSIFQQLKNIIRDFISKISKPTTLDEINSVVDKYFDTSWNEGDIAKRNQEYEWGLKFKAAESIFDRYNNNPQSISEAYHKAKADGSNPELVKAVEEAVSGKPNVISKASRLAPEDEASEQNLPGYDNLMSGVKSFVDKAKGRGDAKSDIVKNAVDIVQSSPLYENASDMQREQMVRDARKLAGASQKSSPSVSKLFGKAKDVRLITMTDYQALKKQIADINRGAKDMKKAWIESSRELGKYVRDMAGKGHITLKQAAAVVKKFSGVNVLSEKSINKFVDYMQMVFENAEYAEKISNIRRMLPNARKNFGTKIGVADGLAEGLARMLSINPLLIPESVLDTYESVVKMMSERKAVLDLRDIQDVTQDVSDVLDAVDLEQSSIPSLKDMFDDYNDKVLNQDGSINFAETISKMVKNNNITQETADIMKKYKSEIMPSPSAAEKTQAEIDAEKAVLSNMIASSNINADRLTSRDERSLARKLSDLIKSAKLERLSIDQLNNLLSVIDNINNGYVPHIAQVLTERIEATQLGTTLSRVPAAVKPKKMNVAYAKLKSMFTKDSALTELIKRNFLGYIDQVFGDYKSKTIFNTILKSVAEAQARFESYVKQLNERLEKAENDVLRSHGYHHNNAIMSKFKMMAYMLQIEYDSNPNNKQVNSAASYIKKTIDHILFNKTTFTERDVKMLKQILSDYTDPNTGQIDAQKIYASFNQAEKKAIKEIRSINDELTDKAVFTAAVIRGDKINPLNNYVHLNVLHEYGPEESVSGSGFVQNFSNSLRPSTKAKSLIERTPGAKPLNFDVFASASRGAKFVYMDYYMTSPIRTSRKTINFAKAQMKEKGATKREIDVINAIENSFETAVEDMLVSNFTSSSFGDEVIGFISRQGYRAVLASVPRFGAELISNISMAVYFPKDFAKGIGLTGLSYSTKGIEFMRNVLSKETGRVFPSNTISGRLVDSQLLEQASGSKGGRAKTDIANKLTQIHNRTTKKYSNTVDTVADTLISTPDKSVMRPMWFGTFFNEFKKVSGVDPDLDKIAANDEQYMLQNKDAIEAAKNKADQRAMFLGSTNNRFMGVLKGVSKKDQSVAVKLFNQFNGFMSRFMLNEFATARTAVYAAMGNGMISRREGVAILAGVVTRMTVYTILTQTLSNAMVGMFVDDEEEDEKSFDKKVEQAMASTMTSLLVGRNLGNMSRGMVNYGVEMMNEKYLDFLREGEYDPYKDAIQYSFIPPERKGQGRQFEDLIVNMMGPLGPSAKTGALMYKTYLGKEKEQADAIERQEAVKNTRIPLEVFGNLGMVPLYKDIRKIALKEIYKGLDNKSSGGKDDDISKKYLKENYPDTYNQLYGKGGSLSEVEEAKKIVEEEKKRIKKEIKDMGY